MSLKWKLALRFLISIIVIGALLFIPAGSFRFWEGWVYILIMYVPGFLAFAYFYKHNPQPIERRMQFREKVHDLGRGKRMLVRGGKLDPKYNITVPESIDAGG